MIHFRTTVQIAPGRQADAVARAHEWAKTYKDSTGIDIRVSVVTTGTLGRICLSVNFESMGAREAADAKWQASPATQALGAKQEQEVRAGTCAQLTETFYDEHWRDA
jgi:hypothetical protein